MNVSAKGRFVLAGMIALVVIAVVAYLIFAAGSGASAPQLLAAAQAKTAEATSYRLVIEARQSGEVGEYQTFTEIVMVVGEGIHMISRTQRESAPQEYQESLLVQDRRFVRAGPTEAWESSVNSFDPSVIQSLTPSDRLQLVDGLVSPEIVGEEEVNGVPCTKIRGETDMHMRAGTIWGDDVDEYEVEPKGQFVAGSEDFTVWVGVDDGLVRAYEATSSYPRFDTLSSFDTWYRVEFSDFNAPLELPNPD